MTPLLIDPLSPNGLPTTNASSPTRTLRRIAEDGRDELGRGLVGLDHRDVVLGLLADDLGARGRAVGERELDRVGVRDDVQAR